MRVRDRDDAPVRLGADGVADATLLGPGKPHARVELERARLGPAETAGIEDDRVAAQGPELVTEQDRVRLAGQRRAQETVVKLGDRAAEPGAAEQGARGNGAERAHPAPLLELRQRPDRELLQAERRGAVSAREPDHVLEEAASLRRYRVPVEDVPAADEERQERTSLGACCERAGTAT